jgi:hypothetical protein
VQLAAAREAQSGEGNAEEREGGGFWHSEEKESADFAPRIVGGVDIQVSPVCR